MDTKVMGELLKKSVDDLEITARTYNALRNAGCETLADVVVRTAKDYKKVKNFGKKSTDELEAVLATMGLCLGMDSSAMPLMQLQDLNTADLPKLEEEQRNLELRLVVLETHLKLLRTKKKIEDGVIKARKRSKRRVINNVR